MDCNAVQVENISFKYNKVDVLQNVYMTVPKYCIYALLGPSGSGKTTLLRLLLGRMKPKCGTINIFGNDKPGYFNRIIGYMPQSHALSLELTIGETINYFASLYQLSAKRFIPIKKTLKRIFCLGEDNQIVSTLSGGQQKALSLALVFLHSPKLVFLDEPTVGTDPVLGDQIWSFLRSNCCNGLTVIIVTHYIQEASFADQIGMMRNGYMIEEGVPKMLYCKYNETNLETIFIKICTEKINEKEAKQRLQSYQGKIVSYLSYQHGQDLVQNKKNSLIESDHQGQLTFYQMFWLLFILVRRNIHKFLNSKMTSVMIFSPMFCTLLMCITFKVDKILLPTAVFNQDIHPFYSNKFQENVKNFSIYHIKYISMDSLEAAVSAVEKGQAIAALWFETNFTSALIQRAFASLNENHDSMVISETTTGPNMILDDISTTIKISEVLKNEDNETLINNDDENFDEYEEELIISNETLKASTIKIFIDNSNMFYSQPIMDLLNSGSWNLFNRVVKDQGHHTLTSPVHIKEVIYAEGTEIPDFLLSGYMIGFLYLSQVTLTSQLLIQERNDGFFDRAIVAGAKHSLMFFSHFITNLIFSLVQIILMFVIGFIWYSIPNFGSYSLIFLLVFFQSTSSIMTGLLISATCEENFSAFFISLSITLSQLFTSGAIFPIISFDPVIKFFLSITPISMPVESLRNAMLRGWDLSNIHVLHGLITNLIITILFGFLALYFFKRRS